MRELPKADIAQRLIRAATGEDYGDGELVTNLIGGYADERYGDQDALVVLGNWNNKRWAREGEPELTKAETLPSRLATALDKLGVETLWLDEWNECSVCYRAIRTQPDSYSWTPNYSFTEDGYVCGKCLHEDVGSYVEPYINEATKAITWANAADLAPFGWEPWKPEDVQRYESGWYPGQDDDPRSVLDSIHENHPTLEVVFIIDDVGQFDTHWSAVTRDPAIVKAEPEDAGCWVDGHWGQYGLAHLVLKATDYGYADAEMIDYATRHMASMSPNGDEDLTDDEHEAMSDGADDVESWLNAHVAPEGYSFGWQDGEFFLWADAEWEDEDDEPEDDEPEDIALARRWMNNPEVDAGTRADCRDRVEMWDRDNRA